MTGVLGYQLLVHALICPSLGSPAAAVRISSLADARKMFFWSPVSRDDCHDCFGTTPDISIPSSSGLSIGIDLADTRVLELLNRGKQRPHEEKDAWQVQGLQQ